MTPSTALALVISLSAALGAGMALADPAPAASHCRALTVCRAEQEQKPQLTKKPQQQAKAAPRIGDSARGAPQVQPGKTLATPPHGQEYRLLNRRVVLVDKGSQAVVKVLGAASAKR